MNYNTLTNKELLDVINQCQGVLLHRKRKLISDKNTFDYIISIYFQNNVLLLQYISESNFRLYTNVNDSIVNLALKEMKKHNITFYKELF